MKSDTIKVLVSTITAISGIGGSYWKMEDRVTKLEQQLAQQALGDPRVAIEAGRHITDSGKGLALNNETGDVSVENME